jgi:hypothetical protein
MRKFFHIFMQFPRVLHLKRKLSTPVWKTNSTTVKNQRFAGNQHVAHHHVDRDNFVVGRSTIENAFLATRPKSVPIRIIDNGVINFRIALYFVDQIASFCVSDRYLTRLWRCDEKISGNFILHCCGFESCYRLAQFANGLIVESLILQSKLLKNHWWNLKDKNSHFNVVDKDVALFGPNIYSIPITVHYHQFFAKFSFAKASVKKLQGIEK